MKLMEIVASIICNTLSDPQVLERARLRKGAFTRNCDGTAPQKRQALHFFHA